MTTLATGRQVSLAEREATEFAAQLGSLRNLQLRQNEEVYFKALNTAQDRRAKAQLESISKLSDNWDGCGAAGIDSAVARNASELLWRAGEWGFYPDLAPTPAGTIELEWHHQHFSASIEVGKRKLSLLAYKDEALIRTGYIDASDAEQLATFGGLLRREMMPLRGGGRAARSTSVASVWSTSSEVPTFGTRFLPEMYERNQTFF